MHLSEAIAARDAVIQHLNIACRSIQEKTATIDLLMREKNELESKLLIAEGDKIIASDGACGDMLTCKDPITEIFRLETIIQELRNEVRVLREQHHSIKPLSENPSTCEGGQRILPQVCIARQLYLHVCLCY